jgi:Ca-activated chloride channel homolog
VPAREVNPRDFIFVVDISGSMHGFPLETAKVLMQDLLGGLRPSDTFNVMLFSGSSRMLSAQSVPATRANIEQAIATLRQTGGGGSTEIVPALKRIATLPKADGVSRSVIVITDGYVSVESEVFQLVARHLNRQNVFAFGIGSSVNRHLIEGLARAGQGEAFVVTKPEHAAEQAARFRRMVDTPVLTQLQARFEGINVSDVEPAQLPDVLAGRPVLLFGKWRDTPTRAGTTRSAGTPKLVIEGRSADGAQRLEAAAREDRASSSLRHLWARQRIATLADQEALDGGPAQKAAITELGLHYGLLTAYTSFIAIDQVVRNSNPGLTTNVDQPLPLPEGVSPLAVGGAQGLVLGAQVPSTPEPSTWAALSIALLALGAAAFAARRRAPKCSVHGGQATGAYPSRSA